MATITKGRTFLSGETVTPQKLNALVDDATISGIVNSEIAAGAGIVDTKLAVISTPGKVANSATSATNANTPNTIVARDGSGNFSAGTITANITGNVSGSSGSCTGNAATATQASNALACSGNAATANLAAACSGNSNTATRLQTARTINGVAFDGSANITVTADPNAHTHTVATASSAGFMSATDKSKLDGIPSGGGGITGAVAISQGGTGATTAAGALTNLGAASASHSHTVATASSAGFMSATDKSKLDGIPSGGGGITGTVAISQGGTGATTAAEALTNLGAEASFATRNEVRLDIGYGYPSGYAGKGNEGIDLFYGYTDPRIFINSYGTTASPYLEFGVGYTIRGSITRNAAGTAVAYNTTSDYRLKTNIEPLTDAVARLLQIPVHRFNWLADPTAPKVDGFLAHEAQAVVPESVTGHKDEVDAEGKPIHQGIDQSKLVPLLVAAVQELAARVAALESK